MNSVAMPGEAPTRTARQPASLSRIGLRTAAFTYLLALLVVPLLVILRDGLREGLSGLLYQVRQPVAMHAIWLTLWTAAVMTVVNTVMGTLTAYVMERYTFPGKRLLNALIDLPLAIPSLVTGVMLVVLFGPQQALGAWLKQEVGLAVIFAPPGIILALLFTTFPLIVRAVQPVLQNQDRAPEKAAAILGANGWTIFRRITLPPLVLPITSGALLSFARAIGEFGAIVIVAGNIPFFSQTAAVYVFGEVESENRIGASAVSIVMLAMALILLVVVNALQRRMRKA